MSWTKSHEDLMLPSKRQIYAREDMCYVETGGIAA